MSLFKPLGSLNWLFCPTCNELGIRFLTPTSKYLLKRAQTNWIAPLKVTVVNSHRQKKADEAAQEEARYKRFLGTAVDYTTKSFEDFVSDPLAVIRHLN